MKRPNVKRMQKHAARSTPNHLSRHFDGDRIWAGDDSPHLKWIHWYLRRMQLKHGPNAAVESWVEQNYATGGVLIMVNVIVDSKAVQEWRRQELAVAKMRALGI